MHFLFVKHALAWPRSSGHDVHGYYMMRALVELGHDVSLATVVPPGNQATEGLQLANLILLNAQDAPHGRSSHGTLTWLQEKFRSYWGIEREQIRAVRAAACSSGADVVVAVGLEVLPYLAEVTDRFRVWYAADEWFWHHMSVVRLGERETWGHVHTAFVKGAYERAYRSIIDQAWVVSERDRWAMRLVGGVKSVPVIPNGVDTDYYQRVDVPQLDRSCVFWGRLDFEPNLQALDWFCKNVWPVVRKERPDARFQIYGFNPTDHVQSLAQLEGVSLAPDLPDIRREVSRHQIVVLPFRSGGGIKNKLLEAASMSLPIVCTRRTANGLNSADRMPLLTAESPSDWAAQLLELWDDSERRSELGSQLREWITTHHSWNSAASKAVDAIGRMNNRGRQANKVMALDT